MSNTMRMSAVLGLCVISMGWFVVNADPPKSQDAPKKKLPDAQLDLDQSKFMRKKLEASSQILEGLTTENAALITEGARILAEMSTAEKWQVNHDVMYKQFSGEFQRSATGLLEAAEKSNFDAAALKWIDTTMKCIECHKFVRGARIANVQR
jgi:hypothetical protein